MTEADLEIEEIAERTGTPVFVVEALGQLACAFSFMLRRTTTAPPTTDELWQNRHDMMLLAQKTFRRLKDQAGG